MSITISAEHLAEQFIKFGQFISDEQAAKIAELENKLAAATAAAAATATPPESAESGSETTRVLSAASYAVLAEFEAARNSDAIYCAGDVKPAPAARGHSFPEDMPVIYAEGSRPTLNLGFTPAKIDALLPMLASFPLRDHNMVVAGRGALVYAMVGTKPGNIMVNFVDVDEAKAVASIEALRQHLQVKYPDEYRAERTSCNVVVFASQSCNYAHVYCSLVRHPRINSLAKQESFCWDGKSLVLSEYGKLCIEKGAVELRVRPIGVNCWARHAHAIGFDLILPNLDMAKLSTTARLVFKESQISARMCCGGRWHGVSTIATGWLLTQLSLEDGAIGATMAMLRNAILSHEGRIVCTYGIYLERDQKVDALIPTPPLEDVVTRLTGLIMGASPFATYCAIFGGRLALELLAARVAKDPERIAVMIKDYLTELGVCAGQGFMPLEFVDAEENSSNTLSLRKDWYGEYYRDI